MVNYYAVAGLGRCGTSMMRAQVVKTLREKEHSDQVHTAFAFTLDNGEGHLKIHPIYHFSQHSSFVTITTIPYNKIETEAWDKFRMYRVFKTHAYPPDIQLPKKFKLIWMFGNPMNIVVSGEAEHSNNSDISNWRKLHYINSHSPHYERHEEIYTSDTLMLENHFDTWYKPQPFEFLSLRYEALYNPAVKKKLDKFLGFKLRLPPFKQRSTDWRSHIRRADLEATYGRLNSKMEAAEDLKLWKPQ